ncbi:hypothetical protein [Amycolatopsis sp. NPDC051061]|uniref:hypothetical protein n=1 Tax=Amycolatopsis sp. NPDC051061 TaxID=3155042 RepID=UPI003445E784
MNSSQFEDERDVGRSALARVLLVAGALVGFAVLAVLKSGTANAAERSSPEHPDRPGLLSAAEQPLRAAVQRADPLVRPVTDVVHTASSRVAPVVTPVTDLVEPVLAPVTRAVVKAVAPVLSVVRPVTEPVLRPVLHAVAPVTEPVVRAVGADSAVEAVAGKTTTPPDDVRPAPAQPGATGRSEAPFTAPERATSSAASGSPASVRPDRETASRMSGPDGGGTTPPAPAAPAASGSMSAGSAGQHGGEYAVTGSGSTVPGTDRTRRAPPGGHASLYWLVFYGNDHPS